MGADLHQPVPQAQVDVRLAQVGDAEAIRTIYNREVTGSTATFDLVPRTLEAQIAWIESHGGAHPAVVATVGDDVVGFGSLHTYRDRPAYATTVENSVYVHHERRGLGVGKAVLGELVRLGTAHGFHTVIARIVGGNEASVALHEACGFRVIGTEAQVGRKLNQWLDVVVMQRML